MIPAGRLKAPSGRPTSDGELFETLARSGAARFERIVSPPGTTSPPGWWYDQGWDEFVMLVSGSAEVRLETEDENRRLLPGDRLFLPARVRHRVERTHATDHTVWLAVHVGEPGATGRLSD